MDRKYLDTAEKILKQPFVGYTLLADGIRFDIINDFKRGVVIDQTVVNPGRFIKYRTDFYGLMFDDIEEALIYCVNMLNAEGSAFGW